MSAIEVWTDGSGTTADRPGGAGVVVVHDGVVVAEVAEGLPAATNNTAEAWAIGRALQLVADGWGYDAKIIVCSDSEWACGATWPGSRWEVDRTNLSGRVALRVRRLAQRFASVEVRHVKGHSGLVHNERADELAGMARKRVVAALESAGAR